MVGNYLEDNFIKLDENRLDFELNDDGAPCLDLAFSETSLFFQKKTSVKSGSAVAEEIFKNFGVTVIEPDEKSPDSRFILSLKNRILYITPTTRKYTDWKYPSATPDWLFLDPSANLKDENIKKIETYLKLHPKLRLAVFPDRRNLGNLAPLISRADLIFATEPLKSLTIKKSAIICKIGPDSLSVGNEKTAWKTERKDLMTDLTVREIASATFLAALLTEKNLKTALNFVKISLESTTLTTVPSVKFLKEKNMQEETPDLALTAKLLVARGKGILAADESGGSIHKKFEGMGIDDTFDNRRDYRNIFFTTPDLEKYVNGVILFDETARQLADDGTNFVKFLTKKGIIPGIKVDMGLEPLSENSKEVYTKGLDGLDDRLREYFAMGLRFAKWRAAFYVGDGTPSAEVIEKNCDILSDYAKKCQDAHIVPIVEPELVHDGDYSVEACAEITGKILDCLFEKLKEKGVKLEGTLLKVNMILAGSEHDPNSTPEEVGKFTNEVLKAHVPKNLAGVVFLSGGQTPDEATENLKEIIKQKSTAFPLTFSFARALQAPALEAWRGDNANADAARLTFKNRLIKNTDALNTNYGN